jgi:hypothetical protein
VTHWAYDNQGSLGPGFCTNLYDGLVCGLACPNKGVNPGDPVCSPTCVCALMPPICGSL